MASAAGGDDTSEDEANDVGNDLEDDDPPGILGFHTGLLRLGWFNLWLGCWNSELGVLNLIRHCLLKGLLEKFLKD